MTEEQTISKWEIGDSTPDMEKLIAISELFNVSLDELMLGKKAGKGLKIAGTIAGVILTIDLLSMIVYFCVFGIPK